VEIRRAELSDAETVADVFVTARLGMTYLPPLDIAGASAYIREQVVPELETWVALEERRIVGFAAVDGEDLAHLYVVPAAQGQGVGTALFDLVKALHADGFELWVFQRNEGARRFYERHGCVLLRETDGSGNMEKEPDARYAWLGKAGHAHA
jgi:GNAT superfamily N-acetyltransferase